MENSISLEPLYVQISNKIINDINSKKYKYGDRLPSEQDLSVEFETSRGTIRKALQVLTRDGYIETIHGKGSFVTDKRISSPIAQDLVSIEETLEAQNLDFTTTVIKKVVVKADGSLVSRFDIEEGSEVMCLERVRYIDEEPCIFLRNWVSVDRIPGIDFFDYDKIGLFNAIERSINEKIAYGLRTFKAINADEEISKYLNLSNEAVLKIIQTTYNTQDEPIEYSEIFIKSDKYQVTSKLVR